jgi:hypothetical protein
MGPESLVVGQADRLRTIGGTAQHDEPIRWTTTTPDLIGLRDDGRIEAVAAGLARVAASHGPDSASYQLRIVGTPAAAPALSLPPTPPPQTTPVIAEVAITPAATQLEIGQSATLTLLARDSRGAQLIPDQVEWITTAPAVARISASGVVMAVAPGTARIHVTADGVEGSADVTVSPVRVDTVALDRTSLRLTVGETATLSARPQSAAGQQLDNRRTEWTSANPAVASVSPSGVVTARAPGRTRIEARVEGVTGFTQVTVSPPAEPEPPPPPENSEPLIRAVVDRYATAIQSENLTALQAVYPGMPEREAETWRAFFQAVTDLQVETEVLELSAAGERATVRVRQVLLFRSTRRDRQESEFVASMERDASGWHIARIN